MTAEYPRSEFDANRSVASRERRWVLVFAFIVMLVTSLPYLLGYGIQGDDYRFTGFIFGTQDGNSYIAKMLSGTYGAWLFRTPYTAYPQKGAFLFLPYISLGKLAWPPSIHVQLVALYHLFRFVGGILAILASYDFLAHFLADVRLRRFGLALVTLGGGLGWILVLVGQNDWLGSLPLEFYSPESFGFLGLFGVPHLALARALLLWALLVYLRGVEDRAQTLEWQAISLRLGMFWFLAGLMQPLTTLVIGALIFCHLVGLGVWQLKRGQEAPAAEWEAWRQLVRLGIVASILPVLLVLLNVWTVMQDPFVAAWTTQNILKSPHPAHYMLAYGLVLPYAWLGGRRLMRSDPWKGWLLVGWVLLLPLLAYAPVNMQRRLPEATWVALVTLAMAALDAACVGEAHSAPRRRSAPLLPLFLVYPSTLFLFVGGLLAAGQPGKPIFRPAPEVEIFEYLSETAEPYEVVMSSFETGNALPAWAPLRVLVGHGPESAHLAELLPQVSAFYSAATPDERRIELVHQFDARYVFWGPTERALGDWDPFQAPYLEFLYQAGEYTLFLVRSGR